MELTKGPLNRIIELLKKGTDLKLLAYKSAEAEQILREASEITDSHDIPSPWPQLVSYRLGHILMRRAKTHEDYDEVLQCFNIASLSNSLGPLPRIYRLAAMFRCGREKEKMRPVFESLLGQIDSYTENIDPADSHDQQVIRQNYLFNMVELAVYFTGYPYDELEGKGKLNLRELGSKYGSLRDSNPYSDLHSKMDNWGLVGSINGLASTPYPGEIALEELEDRMEKGHIKPPCIAFRISEDETVNDWNFNLKRKENGKFDWDRPSKSSKYLRLLAAIYIFKDIDSKNIFLKKFYDDSSKFADDNMRQLKSRCCAEITKKINKYNTTNKIEKRDIFFNSREYDSPVPMFKPGISVIGAIDNKLFW